MGLLDTIISVNVTSASTAVATQSFATPIIIGPTKGSGAVSVQTFTQPADMLTAGYTTSSTEYIYATAMFAQTIRPATFKVAQRSSSGAIDADIAAIQALDDTWYAAIFPLLSDADIVTAATAIESLVKIAFFASPTAAIATTATNDVASLLQAKNLSRSALVFSPGSATQGVEAAWVGGQINKAPGGSTWAYKAIQGIAVDSLTTNQFTIVEGTAVTGVAGKNANTLTNIGGANVMTPGMMSNGGFIDLRIGTDSLTSAVKTNIYQTFISNDKIFYTEAGCVLIESAIRQAWSTHVGFNFLDGSTPLTITHTPVANVPSTQRQKRIAPPFNFSCRTTGGIHSAVINGQVNI